MYESQTVLTDDMVSSFERCQISFEGYLLKAKDMNPLQIDTRQNSVASPLGTETPPSSPGKHLLLHTTDI